MVAPKTVLLWIMSVCAVYAAPQDPAARRQQAQQEAQAAWPAVERALKATLEKVNLNQRLTDQQLQRAAELVEANRRFLPVYEPAQKTGYLLLASWTAYFQKEYANALNLALRAFRDDPASGDAWATQALMSLAQCRRPAEPPTARARQRTRRADEAMEAMPAEAAAYQPGVLAFSPAMLRTDLMRQRFMPAEWKTIDGKTVAYKQGETILGLLLWKQPMSGSQSADPFADGSDGATVAPTDAAPNVEPMIAPMGMPMAMPAAGQPTPNIELAEQQAYVDMLSELLAKTDKVVFAEVSLNPLKDIEIIKKERLSVAPLIMAQDASSGAGSFARWEISAPTLLLVNPEGTVCYAGPAIGLAPAFLLSHWTGAAIDLAALRSEPREFVVPDIQPAEDGQTPPAAMPMPPMMPGMPGMPEAMPPADGQPTDAAAPQPEKKYKDLPPEQQADAEKKLEYARDVFMKAAKLRVQTYRRGVDICRDILQKYPDTIYAEQARALLRQIPEKRREQYNITPQELGQTQ